MEEAPMRPVKGPKKKPRSLTLELASHAAMGMALGLAFCWALVLIEPFDVVNLIAHNPEPKTTAIILIGFVSLTFGLGATLTGMVLTTLDEN
jgi:hypothetical protein